MSVQIIAENFVRKDHFQDKNDYVAIDQAGMYIGQPMPDKDNQGDMRIIASGGINNELSTFQYKGAISGTGSTIYEAYDTYLSKFYGNTYFQEYDLLWVTGLNEGESDTITSFTQSNGKLTFGNGFTNIPQSGDEYVISLNPKQLQFQIQCVVTGGPGVGHFKMSEIRSADTGRGVHLSLEDEVLFDQTGGTDCVFQIIQMANGNLLALHSNTTGYVYGSISTTKGLSWEDPVQINTSTSGYDLRDAIVLKNGTILVFSHNTSTMIHKSTDNAETWSDPITLSNIPLRSVVELESGYLLGVYEYSNAVYCRLSADQGSTWTDAVTVANDTGNQTAPDIIISNEDELVCAYESTEDATGYKEIKCKISTDGGATWGSSIEIAGESVDQEMPRMFVDLTGDLYCTWTRDTDFIYGKQSYDGGETWTGTSFVVFDESTAGDAISECRPVLLDGHTMVFCWSNETDATFYFNHAREPGYYASSLGIEVPFSWMQYVARGDVKLRFLGNRMVEGDSWTFVPEYEYHISNIIDDSRHKVHRSTLDNQDHSPELRTGDNVAGNDERFHCNGVALFDCNVVSIEHAMDDYEVWASATVTTTVPFEITTGIVDDTNGPYIKDTSLLANYPDHSLMGKMVQFTSGNSDGLAYRIADNAGDWIKFTSDKAIDCSATDTFSVYGTKAAATFTETLERSMRLHIDAHKTPDGYYQIGKVIMGMTITLDRAWMPGYGNSLVDGTEYVRSKHGDIYPMVRRDNKRVFEVKWNAQNTVLDEIIALKNFISGRNVCLIPDSSDMLDIYLVKMIGDINITNYANNTHNFSITFEEV